MGVPKKVITTREETMVGVDDNCDVGSQCINGIMMRVVKNNKR